MKKIIGITMLFFTLCFSIPLLASANEDSVFDTYGIKNYEVISSQAEEIQPLMRSTFSTSTSWLTLPSQQNVDLNKEWTITFSGGTVSLDKIAGIVIEKNGAFIPVKIRLFPAANQAVVSPLESYLPNETYTVRAFLENGLRYKMSFTTKGLLTQNELLGNTYGNISNFGYVVESDDWIYYRNQNDNGYLYKMRTDGTENTSLLPNADIRNIYGLNVMGGWVYFTAIKDDYSKIYKVRADGSNLTEIGTANRSYSYFYHRFNRLIVTNNYIYVDFWNGRDYDLTHYYLDGALINDNIKDDVVNSLISNNLVISIDRNSEKLNIYDMNTKKSIYTSLERVSGLNLFDNWIFYINKEDYRIYKIKLDGSQKQKVNDDWTTFMNVHNGWIYFINDVDQSVNRIRTDGTQKQQLTDDKGRLIFVTTDWIFYTNPTNNKMYKMAHDGGNWSEVK